MEDRRHSPLSDAQLEEALEGLPLWTRVQGRPAIRRRLQLRNFDEAWDVLNRVADVARRLEHHPEIFNLYSQVRLTLWTYECRGVTAHDVALAHAIDEALEA